MTHTLLALDGLVFPIEVEVVLSIRQTDNISMMYKAGLYGLKLCFKWLPCNSEEELEPLRIL